MPLVTKTGDLPWDAPTNKIILPFNHVLWHHMTNLKKRFICFCSKHIGTKLNKLAIYLIDTTLKVTWPFDSVIDVRSYKKLKKIISVLSSDLVTNRLWDKKRVLYHCWWNRNVCFYDNFMVSGLRNICIARL